MTARAGVFMRLGLLVLVLAGCRISTGEGPDKQAYPVTVNDLDGDGILNADDDDVDGDGILNGDDTDVDGDGLANDVDDDIDGDGVANDQDNDIDGDGIENADDRDEDGDGVLNEDDPDSCDPPTWHRDQDGDGYGAGPTRVDCHDPGDGWAINAGDCDDRRDDVHPRADELCDGVRNDCDGTGLPADEADADADGQMGCEGDCIDTNPNAYLGAAEVWYDGIDQDCRGGNDYDQDGDQYVHEDHASHTSPRAPHTGDCDDTDLDVHPRTLEWLHDSVDQDCDGGVDTTAFGFDSVQWEAPRRPVVTASTDHYVLATGADDFLPGASDSFDAGIVLRFDLAPGFNEPFVDPPLFWQSPIPPSRYPLGMGIDMTRSAGRDALYAAGSYYRPSNDSTYLIVREYDIGTNGNYNAALAYDGIIGQTEYNDLDLVRASNGDYWVFACADDTLQFFRGNHESGTWRKKDHAWVTGLGGDTCFLDVPAATTGTAQGTVCDSTGCTTYTLDATQSPLDAECTSCFTVNPNASWATRGGFTSADRRGNWLVATDPSAGVLLYEFGTGTEYTMLPNQRVYAADMWMHDGEMYLAAVVQSSTSAGGREVKLQHGNPNAVAMSTSTWDFSLQGRSLTPEGISVYADDRRLFLAVSGSGPATNPGTTPQDAVGWAFVGR